MAPTPPPLQQRAEQLAATLPPLLVAAERVAATVAQGVHGRRRVGLADLGHLGGQFEVIPLGPGRDAELALDLAPVGRVTVLMPVGAV